MVAPQKVVVAGIGTEVGKTIVSAALLHRLKADDWKPIQAGELENSDSHNVSQLVGDLSIHIHSEAFRLKEPMSPHAAAAIEDRSIHLNELILPETENHLVVELAGGIMVPINNQQTSLDWLKKMKIPVVLVSRYYLGQINHTLLTIEVLKSNKVPLLGIIFNGEENLASKQAILQIGNTEDLGTIPILKEINSNTIARAANEIRLERAIKV